MSELFVGLGGVFVFGLGILWVRGKLRYAIIPVLSTYVLGFIICLKPTFPGFKKMPILPSSIIASGSAAARHTDNYYSSLLGQWRGGWTLATLPGATRRQPYGDGLGCEVKRQSRPRIAGAHHTSYHIGKPHLRISKNFAFFR